MESYSLSRSHMYFLSSRYAVIIFLLLQHLELPVLLRRVPMDCSVVSLTAGKSKLELTEEG